MTLTNLETDLTKLKIIEPKFIQPTVDEKTGKVRYYNCIDEKCFTKVPVYELIRPIFSRNVLQNTNTNTLPTTIPTNYICLICKKIWDKNGNILNSETTEPETTTQ